MKIPMGAFARLATIGLAGWLWISCYFWEREANGVLMLGLIMVAVITAMELMSFADKRVRFGSTMMGALIVVMGLFMHHRWWFLRWHDAVLGAAIILLSLIPNPEVPAEPDTTVPAPAHAPAQH